MKFLSRKLFAAAVAMGAITGLLVGLAIIDTALLETNKDLLIIAIAAIAGLGGFAVNKQAQVDQARVYADAELEETKNASPPFVPFPPPAGETTTDG